MRVTSTKKDAASLDRRKGSAGAPHDSAVDHGGSDLCTWESKGQ